MHAKQTMATLSDGKKRMLLQKWIYDLHESIISLREKCSNALFTEEVLRKDNLKSSTGVQYIWMYYYCNYTSPIIQDNTNGLSFRLYMALLNHSF